MPIVAPGPRGHWLVGSLPDLRNNPVAFFRDLERRYGPVARFSFGGHTAHLISSPTGIRHVLQTNARNYTKKTPGIQKLKAILGEGLLTSDGEFWLRQRRIAQPAFQHERLLGFAPLIERHTRTLIEEWLHHADKGLPVDAHKSMMALTLTIVGEALFGADVSADAPVVARSLDTLLAIQDARFSRPITIPSWAPTPENRRFNEARAALDAICHRMIAVRRNQSSGGTDLLSLLLNARDPESGEGMTDRQLRDEVVTVFVTGHETTANVLAFALYLLAKHPIEQCQLRVALHDRFSGSYGCLDAHRFAPAAQILDETMRLYPPAWLFARAPEQDDRIDGFAIPAGSFVFISALLMHRLAQHWPNPDDFAPSRFVGGKPDRYVYFPFGLGQRQCIGAGLAELEMHFILSQLATHFSFTCPLPSTPTLDAKVTLRPYGPVPLMLTPLKGLSR